MPAVEVAINGTWARLVGEGLPPDVASPGRGLVYGFSVKSRRRLLALVNQLVNQLDKSACDSALFVGLTYPRVFSPDCTEWKRDLDAWLKRFFRRWPLAGVIWRLEFQQRGAPHFHLLIFGVQAISKDWLSESWYEVVGSDDSAHLRAGTSIQRVRSRRGIVSYVSKYMAKPEQFGNLPTGRVWGHRGSLPIEIVSVELDWAAWYRLRRVGRSWLSRRLGRVVKWSKGKGQGMTWLIDSDCMARALAWAAMT